MRENMRMGSGISSRISAALMKEAFAASQIFTATIEPTEKLKMRVAMVIENELSDRQRETVLLVCEGKSLTEVAAIQGLDASTVCRTFHRGMRRLRRFLQY